VGASRLRVKVDGSTEKKWDTVIPADLKRLFVSGTYMSPLVTKGLKIPKQTRKQKHTFRVSQGSVSTVIIPRVAGSLSSSFSR